MVNKQLKDINDRLTTIIWLIVALWAYGLIMSATVACAQENSNYFVRQAVGTAADHVIGTCITNEEPKPQVKKFVDRGERTCIYVPPPGSIKAEAEVSLDVQKTQ